MSERTVRPLNARCRWVNLTFNAMYGKRIREFRKWKRLTQVRLARKLGLTQGTISKMENSLHLPSLILWKRMAKVFGCTLAYLLGRLPPMGSA